jgi:hypothetical protein
MKTTTARIASVAATIASAGSCAAALAWLFSFEGSVGAWTWGLKAPFVALAVLAALPAIPAAIAFLAKGAPRAAVASIAIASLSICAHGAIIAYVSIAASEPIGDVGELVLLDPGAPPKPSSPLGPRIALSSDPHVDREASAHEERRRALRTVAAGGYDAFFCLGDHVELGMQASGWRSAIAEFSRELGGVPFRPLMGNHDAVIGGQGHWIEAFFPHELPESGSPFYWSVEWPQLKLIALNVAWDESSLDARQLSWLERKLAEFGDAVPVVVLAHAFVLSSGYVDGDSGMPWYDQARLADILCPILERHRVDLVVSGHNHYMEYLERNGVAYAVVGALGGVPDPDPEYVSPHSKWFRRGMYGFLELAILDGSLALTFRAANGDALFEKRIGEQE